MLKRTMRSRTLCESAVSQYEVDEAVEKLLKGGKPSELESRLCKSVISVLTEMRKDALVQRKEQLAVKIGEILGELQHGPQLFTQGEALDPVEGRDLRLSTRPITSTVTSKKLLVERDLESIDSRARQESMPLLKVKLQREAARDRYEKSSRVAGALERAVQYAEDSRRLGPKLLKIQQLEQKLEAAREKYMEARRKAHEARQRNEEISAEAERQMEVRLGDEMVDYGSHVPTSLPLEFSKFSGKLLDTRTRQQKAAGTRRWDEATACKKEAIAREQQELERATDRFAHSYKLQRAHVMSQQQKKRAGFSANWGRKKETQDRQLAQELGELRSTCEHYELLLNEAEQAARAELARTRQHEAA